MSQAAPLDETDSLLKFSTILPDFQDWLTRMADDSAPVASDMDLAAQPYGSEPRQWVEMGRGEGQGGLVPVMIHGGYWRALKAEDHRFVLPALGRLGPLVGNLEYRLMPAARMADLVADVAAGLHLLSESARDTVPNAMLLPIGHSAGAHLAVTALRDDPRFLGRTAGIVSISGIFNLDLVARSFLQTELTLSADEVSRFSVGRAPALPTLFVAGSKETAPFRDQARFLAGTRDDLAAIEAVPCHHMNVLHGTLTGDAPLVPLISQWLAGTVPPQEIEARIP